MRRASLMVTVPSQRSNLNPTLPMCPTSLKPSFSCILIEASAFSVGDHGDDLPDAGGT